MNIATESSVLSASFQQGEKLVHLLPGDIHDALHVGNLILETWKVEIDASLYFLSCLVSFDLQENLRMKTL